jgi:hypothetical protein
MMRAGELIVWLNTKPGTIRRCDDFGDLVRDGYLDLTIDRDRIVAVTASASAPTVLTLPVAADC